MSPSSRAVRTALRPSSVDTKRLCVARLLRRTGPAVDREFSTQLGRACTYESSVAFNPVWVCVDLERRSSYIGERAINRVGPQVVGPDREKHEIT